MRRWLGLSFVALSSLAGPCAFAQTPAVLFAQARQASGANAWDAVANIVAVGTEESSGMVSQWRAVDDLKAPRLARLTDAGLVRYRLVWNGPDFWRQRPSGEVHALNSDFARASTLTDEWLAQRFYLKPDAGGASLSAVTQQVDGAAAFDVVTATPVHGQAVALWFDAATHLLARTVRQQNLNIETIRFGDYRTVGGVKLPFLITTDDGDPQSLDTVHVASYRLNAATAADFARPQRPDDASVAGGRTTVPIRFDGEIVVQAKINGKGPFGFILDTGGHDILSPEAAKAIGLTLEGAGRSGGAGAGTVSEQYARVARMDIGGMSMRNQVFTIIPLSYGTVEQGPRPPLAGILGLEIFERFAVRIDYRVQTLTLEPLSTYRHAGPGTAVPIFFNDDEPLVKGTLDGHPGDLGIDTGNSGSLVIQGHWAEREGLLVRLKSGFDVASFGMGGMTHNWASRVDLAIGGTTLNHLVGRLATDTAGAFASVVEAANVGDQVLANFTVDFDYAKGQMWLAPKPGFVPLPFNRSGLSVTKKRLEAFTVVVVPQNTPAADAGLKVGDEITQIDGVSAATMSGWDMGRVLRKPPGTAVQLTVIRGAKTVKTTLVLRELLP